MRTITTQDEHQKGYTYKLTCPEGKKFHPDFKPELNPQEMLELGIFDGSYFFDIPDDLPKKWFKNAKLSKFKDPSVNFFGISASQPWKVWQDKGWIHPDDPYGWFQWYCRYYLGRRHPDDERQIKRWKAIGRHIAQIKKNCKKGDLACRRKQRQALLHWAIDSRKL